MLLHPMFYTFTLVFAASWRASCMKELAFYMRQIGMTLASCVFETCLFFYQVASS